MKTEELTYHLIKRGAFWSYDKNDLKNISDNILIEECLRWGDVPEIIALFNLFPNSLIKKVWKEKLIPDTRIYPHNYYLASVFFNIKNPKQYIKTYSKKFSRYEMLKKLDR